MDEAGKPCFSSMPEEVTFPDVQPANIKMHEIIIGSFRILILWLIIRLL